MDVTAISAGIGFSEVAHTCAIQNGAAKCWGYNNNGQLGNGSNEQSLIPVQVEGLDSDVTAISAGREHTCAIVEGKAWCWGKNSDGQLGDNSLAKKDIPVAVVQTPADTTDTDPDKHTSVVLLDMDVTAISAGGFTLVPFMITPPSAGGAMSMASWVEAAALPAIFPCRLKGWTWMSLTSQQGISTLVQFTMAQPSAGGKTTGGQLGDNSTTSRSVPVAVVQTPVDGATAAVLLDSGVTAISVGDDHTCAVHNGVCQVLGVQQQWTAGQRTWR